MRLSVLLIILFSLGCSQLPSKPEVFLCSPIPEDSTCFCVKVGHSEITKNIPIGECKIAFTADDWDKIDLYIKDLKKLADKVCTSP